MKKLNKKNRKGFTLVELVVVILIIAILASATFLGGATVIKQSRVTKAQNDLRLYAQYAQDALYENPSWAKADAATVSVNGATHLGKYLTSDLQFTDGESALEDSWENAYNAYFVYHPTAAEATPLTDCAFIFSSNGADATPGKAGGYTYDDVISGGKIVFDKTDGTGAFRVADGYSNDDLVTVVYLNAAGEVSVVSNAQ